MVGWLVIVGKVMLYFCFVVLLIMKSLVVFSIDWTIRMTNVDFFYCYTKNIKSVGCYWLCKFNKTLTIGWLVGWLVEF